MCMEPIKNVGTTAMTVPQNQNQIQGYEDYSSIPMVYEPEIEEKKKASSNMLGYTALALAIVGGIGFAVKHKEVKNLKKQAESLMSEKEALQSQLDNANAKIQQLESKPTKKGLWAKIKGIFKSKKSKKAQKTETKPETKPETKSDEKVKSEDTAKKD